MSNLYSSNIIILRIHIHNRLAKQIFSEKGGENFIKFCGKDIEKAFYIYDSVFFGNKIKINLQKNKVLLKFFASSRSTGFGGSISKNIKEIYLDIAPNIISNLVKKKNNILSKMIGLEKIDRLYCFQIILEHQLIYFFNLWNKGIYEDLLQKYFGYDFNSNLNIFTFSKLQNNMYNSIGLMKNWQNSCYFDSLIMSLFLGASNFPRNIILRTNISEINYKSWTSEEMDKDIHKRKNKIFKPICGIENLDTELKTKIFVKKLQESLQLDYNKLLVNKVIFECHETRYLLANLIPLMKSPNSSKLCSYPVSDLYDILADLFPGLKSQKIPTIINSLEKGITNERDIIEERKSFLFWDFIGPIEEEGSNPIWEKINSQMLVFQNGLIPPLKNYGSKIQEISRVLGPIPGEYNIIQDGNVKRVIPRIGFMNKIINKNRIFEEYIINKKYRLFAVVRNHGFKPETSGINDFGGGHYTSYIRPFFDEEKWYTYDDVGPCWSIINKGVLPDDTFIDTSFSRPELLFYENISLKN